jgi:alpha-beta hydrolase superfamily lysophospholipase
MFHAGVDAEGPPRAVIVLVHGFNAHSGMIWAAEQFRRMGWRLMRSI